MNRKCVSFASLLTLITLLTGTGLVCSSVNADENTDSTITVSVDVACSLSFTEDTAHAASIQNGMYGDDIGTTTLKVLCNDSGGFAVYAIGYSGLEFGNNKMLATVNGGLAPTYDIITGTAKNGNTSNWAMKLNKVTDTSTSYNPSSLTINNSFDAYHNVPDSYTKVATFNSVTDAMLGSKLTTTYAVYISGTQPAGTYEGRVKYTLVNPNSEIPSQPQIPTPGCINYFANVGDAVGTMGCQSVTDGSTVTLLASNFSRDGYGFAGWSDKYDYTTNENAHFYGPNEDITVPIGTTANGLALYAVWVKSQGNLQDTAKVSTLCGTGIGSLTKAPTAGTADLSSVTALTDKRDNQTYAIAKLADGNCWMIENLRLDNTNSDNSTGALAEGYGTSVTYGNFSGLAEPESANFVSSEVANSLYYSGTPQGTASIDISTTNYPSLRFPRYNNLNTANRATNPTSNTFTEDGTTGGMYSYGNYYTWHAAIADLTYVATPYENTTGTSLCPAGWHLPTGGNVTTTVNVAEEPSTWTEFYNLGYGIMGSVAKDDPYPSSPYEHIIEYSSTTTNAVGDNATKAFRRFPNNFVYSGKFEASSARARGHYGYYWSSTARSFNYAFGLYFDRLIVIPGTNGAIKYIGWSIRCISSS